MAEELQEVAEEKDLEVLLKTEHTFPPPEDFVRQANANDPAIYDEAERDFEAWWEKWAKQLDWFEDWQTVLDWNPPCSTSRTTVSTATSRPATATRSPTTGLARMTAGAT
jgi:hypothetical protein